MRGKGEKRFRQTLLMLTTAFSLLLTACGTVSDYEYTDTGSADVQIREYESVADVPEYSGEPYVEINENQPEFTEEEITTEDAGRRKPVSGRKLCPRKSAGVSVR